MDRHARWIGKLDLAASHNRPASASTSVLLGRALHPTTTQ